MAKSLIYSLFYSIYGIRVCGGGWLKTSYGWLKTSGGSGWKLQNTVIRGEGF